MQPSSRKAQLLALMQDEHASLENVLHALSKKQMLRADVVGSWSVKDVLAHLTWWEQAIISEVVNGVELDPGLNGEPWSTERANELMVAAKRDTPLADVQAEFDRSYRQILEVVQGLDEAGFASDDFYALLANNTGNHYAEHRQQIETGLHLDATEDVRPAKRAADVAVPTDKEQPIINITGEKVALGPFQRDLAVLMYKWTNDFAVTTLSGDPVRPVTLDAAQADYERDSRGERRDWIGFTIYERSTMRIIGIAELRRIDMRDRTATYGILIGEKDCWNKGYGTETTTLMLDYAFNVVGLHNIMLDTYSYNEGAIRAYTRAGFRLVGRRREVHRLGDRLYDEVIMECLSTEFQRPAKPVLDLP